MLDECVLAANIPEAGKADLSNNGAELSRSSRDTMRGGTVTGGEGLAGDNEGGSVGSEVLEEVGKAI
jgi:hypothetical protein